MIWYGLNDRRSENYNVHIMYSKPPNVYARHACNCMVVSCVHVLVMFAYVRVSVWMRGEGGVMIHIYLFKQRVCVVGYGVAQSGVVRMISNATPDYYNCLLAGKLVEPGLPAKEYRALLAPGVAPALDDLPPPDPVELEDQVIAPIVDHAGSDSDEVMGPAQIALAAPPLVELDVDAPMAESDHEGDSSSSSSPSSSESSTTVASAVSDEVMGGAPEEPHGPPLDIPALIDGGRVILEDRMLTWGYMRLVLKCSTHTNCRKKRAVGPNQKKHFGQCEPLGYLGAWQRLGATVSREGHKARHFDVPLANQRQWLVDNNYIE
jgi:hypothetical protein